MKRKQILVRMSDYIKYVNENSTNKLDDYNTLYTIGSFPPLFFRNGLEINEEIFNGTPNKYDIIKSDNDHILIKFISKLNDTYRIDLIKEPINNIYHIGFSKYENEINDIENYEKKTNDENSIDVFSRIIWILKDLDMKVEYCIGATGDDKKDSIYEYMMRFVSDWEKRSTNYYNLGWGIYFKI